ncbi:flagellar transcriptional regulator FlhD [Salmonella enterica]|nr:flagellar transcriptional activator FlhD [Salmonella enterica]EBY9433550.1 flagellar transcriptional activator FlhD [Salmonella enterica subsp. enterica serovar Cerro]EIE5050019.1 flagellar transcriptional regulator FlhD [Salmonella enterica subsp. enterica serovar Java]EBR6512336.1 flagellar transcriptional regulator FlhD [Salmonella enterica]EDZ9224104.1 flagellar transcriptional activator FlhD [Salmonella enterica]
MNTEQSLYEMNYTWLSLAQKMLLKDKSVAMFRLGLNAPVAGIIGGMTEAQLHRLSSHPHFLFTLRIRNPAALECLLLDSRVDHLNPMHAAILCLSDAGGDHGI